MRFVFVVLITLSALNAYGQQAAPAPAATPAPIKLGDVTVTGSLRSRVYSWDWFQPASGNNEYQYSGNLLRLNFSQSHRAWQWDAEVAVSFFFFLPAGGNGRGPQQRAPRFGLYYIARHKRKRNTGMGFPRPPYILFSS